MVVREWVAALLIVAGLLVGYLVGRMPGSYRCVAVSDKKYGAMAVIYDTRTGEHYWSVRATEQAATKVTGPVQLNEDQSSPASE